MAAIDAGQLTELREAHYEGAAYLIAGPQNTVFAARVNGAPSSSDYAQIAYDGVTVGAYTDLIVDMDVRISHTNDVRKAFFYGRVRKTPTSSLLYINETSAAVQDNDYIFVVNSYPLVRRKRYKQFLDWDIAYQGLPSIESNVPSASVVLTREGTAQFTFESVPQAVGKGTTTTGVQWIFPNATYIDGSSTSSEVTIEVETPYNEWCHQFLTNSNGTTNALHFTLTAGDPDNPDHTFFRLCHGDVPVSSDWTNGYSTTATYWRGIDDLLDRTRITLVSEETFDGESLGVGNIRYIGYLRNTTSSVEGDENYGQRREAQLDLPGLMQLAGGLRFNQIAIRHSATPSAWDQINVPTPPRNVIHAMRHSTLLNLCSVDLAGLDETYLTGNVNVDETSMMDAVHSALKKINAPLVQAASGALSIVRDPRVGDDAYRASIPDKTPTPITLGDGYSFKFVRTNQDKVGWLEVGFAVVDPTSYTPTFITANAPASGPDDGPEDDTEPSQLLASTSNLNAALTEAKQRTGDLYALDNTQDTIEVNFGSGWGGVVEATPGEYYQFQVAASDDERGQGIDPTDNWLCLSVNMTINRTGTQNTSGVFTKVTRGGDSLINITVNPSVVTTPIPMLPVISPYPAIPMAASINYDATSPTRRIPRDPFSGMQTLPLATEEAAAAAQNQPNPNESRAYTHFNYDTNITMGFTTVLDAEYTITVNGSAQIGANSSCQDLTATENGWASLPTTWATWHSGEGYGRGTPVGRIIIQKDVGNVSGQPLTLYFNEAFTGYIYLAPYSYVYTGSGLVHPSGVTEYTFSSLSFTSGLSIDIGVDENNPLTPLSSTFRLTSLCLGDEEIDGGATLYADAFYQWNEDDDGNPINVQLLSGKGLYLDNAAVAVVPPFNPNHQYTIPFIGTGNPINFRFEDTDYSDNERLPLYVTVTGPGAGS